MANDKPLILVTNDDGVEAPGLKALADAMSELGDVVVVAPDSFQSAMGHAITINNLLRLDKMAPPPPEGGIKTAPSDTGSSIPPSGGGGAWSWYKCSGTPVDCVKIGIDKI